MRLVKLPLLLVVSCLTIAVCHAEDRLSYTEALALAKERGLKWEPRGDSSAPAQPIYVLGPDSTFETTESEGKEVRKRIPYCAIANAPTSIGDILSHYSLYGNVPYAIEILRAASKKPVVKIEGMAAELKLSQYRLQAEDVVVISVKTDDGARQTAHH